MIYRDRTQAGESLAAAVRDRMGTQRVIVLALPRGGVPVAVPVARALGAPLDVLVVRKVGVPGAPEVAMGAVAIGGITLRNAEVLASTPVAAQLFEKEARRERAEVTRRELAYRRAGTPLVLTDLSALLVDDGVATGATVRAAIAAARGLGAARVVVAVPVASAAVAEILAQEADELICLQQPLCLQSVGEWYQEFPQVSDAEVRAALREAAGRYDGRQPRS